jgi:hypothetical protein
LKTNNKPNHAKILPTIASEIDGFPGGFYTLNQNGIVIAQATPLMPMIPDITGFNASQREYFINCQSLQKPVVCNSFLSANRGEQVIVIATPRYDKLGKFIGILDGVVDISSACFSEIAKTISQKFLSKKELVGKTINIFLLDRNNIILGSNLINQYPHGTPQTIFDFMPLPLQSKTGQDGVSSLGYYQGAVDNTPFHIIVTINNEL